MTILITGATGFLGSALVTELLRQQEEDRGNASNSAAAASQIRILARNVRKARNQFGAAATIIQGDITNAEQVRQAVEGVTLVYHLVGRLYHPSVPKELYFQTHVEGTRILLEACQKQKQLSRIVYCSTTGVHGVTGASPVSEDAPFAPTNSYEATKLEGERLALEAHRQWGLPISVIRPGLVYGPGDMHLLGFFRAIKKGFFRVIDGGKALLHPVYIDDVIKAFLLCAQRPQAIGRSYAIAGARPVTIGELARAIAHALGKELPSGNIPLWLAHLVADIFALLPGFQGEHAPLTHSRVRFLTQSRVYSIERAKDELGYAPQVELEEGMRQTVLWYRIHGYL